MANHNENSRTDFHDDHANYLMFMPPPQNSFAFESSEAILDELRILLGCQLKELDVAKGYNGIKVDVNLKSWKESYNWDLLNEKREVVVEIILEFKSVISYI